MRELFISVFLVLIWVLILAGCMMVLTATIGDIGKPMGIIVTMVIGYFYYRLVSEPLNLKIRELEHQIQVYENNRK